jgi:hypothetical protein
MRYLSSIGKIVGGITRIPCHVITSRVIRMSLEFCARWDDMCSVYAGLSYRASRGLLAGVPGGRAGGPVHCALYEPRGVL